MSASAITLVVDGVEVEATEGAMLVDAAKHGDVEIPVFCYEPKLGEPVGACRMCLVEIEGIPKLQTACSTPSATAWSSTRRPTGSRRRRTRSSSSCSSTTRSTARSATRAASARCRTSRWAGARAAAASPTRSATSRSRSRSRRWSGSTASAASSATAACASARRSPRTSSCSCSSAAPNSYVGTFDDRPYVAPFHGNIIELCPVGALTSEAYRFRARPWDIEDAGSICTLCPSQCNVKFTVRDERVQRVLARDNARGRRRLALRQGPLRLPDDQLGGADHRSRGCAAAPIDWAGRARRRGRAAAGRRRGGPPRSSAAAPRTRRATWSSGSSAALGSADVDLAPPGSPPAQLARRSRRPELAVATADDRRTPTRSSSLGADPLHEMPILDLRIRKASAATAPAAPRRHRAPDRARRRRRGDRPLRARRGRRRSSQRWRAELGPDPAPRRPVPRRPPSGSPGRCARADGRRLGRAARPRRGGEAALDALLDLAVAARARRRRRRPDLEVPDAANARGLREAGCAPRRRPRLHAAAGGPRADEIKRGARCGELEAVILLGTPTRSATPDGPGWAEALHQARTSSRVSMFEDASAKNADVILPAETYAEKEGTVTHPDGRLQRLRPSVPHPGARPPALAGPGRALRPPRRRDRHRLGARGARRVASEVPFYAGITPDEIGGTGVRWQDARGRGSARSGRTVRRSAQRLARRSARPTFSRTSTEPATSDGGLRLGTYRDLWADDVTERNVGAAVPVAGAEIELAPADAERLGVAQGDEVEVRSNGTR